MALTRSMKLASQRHAGLAARKPVLQKKTDSPSQTRSTGVPVGHQKTIRGGHPNHGPRVVATVGDNDELYFNVLLRRGRSSSKDDNYTRPALVEFKDVELQSNLKDMKEHEVKEYCKLQRRLAEHKISLPTSVTTSQIVEAAKLEAAKLEAVRVEATKVEVTPASAIPTPAATVHTAWLSQSNGDSIPADHHLDASADHVPTKTKPGPKGYNLRSKKHGTLPSHGYLVAAGDSPKDNLSIPQTSQTPETPSKLRPAHDSHQRHHHCHTPPPNQQQKKKKKHQDRLQQFVHKHISRAENKANQLKQRAAWEQRYDGRMSQLSKGTPPTHSVDEPDLRYGGIEFNRRQKGIFAGKLVSRGKIITIDDEDYVEYRVLTRPLCV